MNYRSFADLNTAITRGLVQVPLDIDLVVGIPRSGLLAASIFALHRNLPLTDLVGFVEGRLLAGGGRTDHHSRSIDFSKLHRVLVLDDSVYNGTAMKRARETVKDVPWKCQIFWGAAFVAPTARSLVDFSFEICPLPRVFEWNILHHEHLSYACVDIDGVLCRDPTDFENDDGPQYAHFLECAEPLVIPTVPIANLVTCRLEKYRELTVAWLARHGVRYENLIMWDLPSKEQRQKRGGGHGQFKGEVYRRTNCTLFIESNKTQAAEIARVAGKPVYCYDSREMLYPSFPKSALYSLRMKQWWIRRELSRWIRRRFGC